jgi:transposase
LSDGMISRAPLLRDPAGRGKPRRMSRRHGKPKELEQLRMVAARMFEMGRPTGEIARAVGRGGQTVRAWRRVWRGGGAAALEAKPHPGREPKLSAAQWQQVLALLARPPAEHGYADAYLWTTTLMARLIKDRFAVDHHHDYVGEMLHKLGWSCQRPAKRAKERDEQAIAAWRATEWPALLKKAVTTAR